MNQVTDLINQWFERVNAQDAEACAALFAPDAKLVAQGAPTLYGAHAIQHALTTFFEAYSVSVEHGVLDIDVDGDLAAVRLSETGTVERRADNAPRSKSGETVLIARRSAGEEWRIHTHIGNLNHPESVGSTAQDQPAQAA